MADLFGVALKSNIHKTPSEVELELAAKRARRSALRDEYDRDISRRKANKEREKALAQAEDLVRLEEHAMYSPWGRIGGGAPLRDSEGEIISNLSTIYNASKKLAKETPLSPSWRKHSQRKYNLLSATGAQSLETQNGQKTHTPDTDRSRLKDTSAIREEVAFRLESKYRSVREAFLSVDRDRSGFIEFHELRRICRLYNIEGGIVEDILRKCDKNYDGVVSYDEFTRSLVRRDYPSASFVDTIIAPSPNLRHRRHRLAAGESPTKLHPPFQATVATKYDEQNNDSYMDTTLAKMPTPGGETAFGTGKMVKSPVSFGKNAMFLVDPPSPQEKQQEERKRKLLVNGLDQQVRDRRMKKEAEELTQLRRTLRSQQRLVERGLDFWGQPIPDGDPHGTARMMAVNTLQQMRKAGIAAGPNAPVSRNHNWSTETNHPPRPSPGEGRGNVPFMSALSSMNGPSPEERRRAGKIRRKLQEDLAAQVREHRMREEEGVLRRLREEMQSRQKKMDSGLDHWGQTIPEDDPFNVRERMQIEQEKLAEKIEELKQKLSRSPGPLITDIEDVARQLDDDFESQPSASYDSASLSPTPNLPRASEDEGEDFGKELQRQDALARQVEIHERTRRNLEDARIDRLEERLKKKIRSAMMTETALRHLFTQFDKINSGRISRFDFQRGFAKLGIVASDEEIDNLVSRFDKNRDGYIDYLEFIRLAMRESRRITKNGIPDRRGNFLRRRMREPSQDEHCDVIDAGDRQKIVHSRQNSQRKKRTNQRKMRRRRQKDKVSSRRKVGKSGQISELISLCKQLLREQDILRTKVEEISPQK